MCPELTKKKLKSVLEKYTSYVGGGRFVTTTSDGDMFALACTRPTRQFYKKETTYVIEMNKNRKVKKVGNYSPSNHYGKNVYDPDGLCPTLCSGSVVKNGLNIIEKDEQLQKTIEDNFTEVEDGKYVTTERECLCDNYCPSSYAFIQKTRQLCDRRVHWFYSKTFCKD